MRHPGRIYIAGPYTKGDTALNLRGAIAAADELANYGFAPFVPHLTHLWHLVSPHDYEFWMTLDAEYLQVCHAVLRLPGVSAGADREVQLAERVSIPVFWKIADLVAYFDAKDAEKRR